MCYVLIGWPSNTFPQILNVCFLIIVAIKFYFMINFRYNTCYFLFVSPLLKPTFIDDLLSPFLPIWIWYYVYECVKILFIWSVKMKLDLPFIHITPMWVRFEDPQLLIVLIFIYKASLLNLFCCKALLDQKASVQV